MISFSSEEIIQNTITFVKKELRNAEGGHDWFHIERVYKNAILISDGEKVDKTVVAVGALPWTKKSTTVFKITEYFKRNNRTCCKNY